MFCTYQSLNPCRSHNATQCNQPTNQPTNQPIKAAGAWGDLGIGVGVLHDVYPYPQIANTMMTRLMAASRLKIPPMVGAEATHGVQMDDHT